MIINNRGKGILCMLLSGLGFAFMSVGVESIENLPVYEKVFSRNLVSLIIATAMIVNVRRKKEVKFLGKKENQLLLWNRSVWGLVGVYLLFSAISAGLPLMEANILSRISPVFVTIFACIFLKEKIPSLQIPALAFILFCSGLAIKPTFRVDILPALAVVLTSVLSGACFTIVRFLKGREEPETIVFHFSLVSVIGMLIPTVVHFVMPTYTQLIWLVVIGIFASVGQFGLTYAYKFAKASEVSIYSYSVILFSIVFDIVFFKKIPDIWSIVGGTGIILASIVLYIQNEINDRVGAE